MRKPRDFDGELKALQDKARDLKSRKVQQLGELVIATGADNLSADELAGALDGRGQQRFCVDAVAPLDAAVDEPRWPSDVG